MASRLLSRLRTPVYENTGSVARDHLASERTFLAWLRTGLGFVTLGIAIERFSQLDLARILPTKPKKQKTGMMDTYKMLVGALLGTGSGSIVYGTARYFSNLRMLERGLFKPAYYGAAGLGFAVAGMAGSVYWSVVKVRLAESKTRENKI